MPRSPDVVIIGSGMGGATLAAALAPTGADILIHEVISDAGLLRNSEGFQAYHKKSHTTATDLGRLATAAKPGLLVLYHGLYYGLPEAVILDEVRSVYDGKVVLANDLDIYP